MQGFTPRHLLFVGLPRKGGGNIGKHGRDSTSAEEGVGGGNLEKVEMTLEVLQAQVAFWSSSSLSAATQADKKLHH